MQMQRRSANAPCHSLFLLFLFGNHHDNDHDFPILFIIFRTDDNDDDEWEDVIIGLINIDNHDDDKHDFE